MNNIITPQPTRIDKDIKSPILKEERHSYFTKENSYLNREAMTLWTFSHTVHVIFFLEATFEKYLKGLLLLLAPVI
jgi:hypothetical protein